MKKKLLSLLILAGIAMPLFSQNVFNIADPIVRYDGTKALGTAQKPDPARLGLQKWVSSPTNGVSLGSASWDASSYKAYFLNTSGVRMAFRLKFPRSYNNPDSAAKKYPVMMFLHGAGEVGCPTNNGVYNNEKQLWLGGDLFRQRVDNNQFDGFLLYPQLVNTSGCWGSWGDVAIANLQINISIIDSMAKYIRADIDRVMVNGLSGGGYGAWRMAGSYPQRIAKIIPSASASSGVDRNAMVHIPVWFATGGKDPDPSPAQAEYVYNRMKEVGSDIRYTQYPDLGHAVWSRHWGEPDYVPSMNDMHKANPLVFFGRNEFCPNETIAGRLGISAGFYAYEWQREGVTIATRTGTVNSIAQPAYVTSFTGNEIVVKSLGTYRVRFRRTASSAWSVFSPKPAVIKTKGTTISASININGNRSKVLPAPDGSTTVPLQLPAGYINYEWYRVSDNVLVGNSQTFNAPVGVYRARYAEQYGCGSVFSPDFAVINANGTPKPDAVTGLTCSPASRTSIRLNWSQGNGETGFEIYRATSSGGPYAFVILTAANSTTYTNTGLEAGTRYYYIMRAVSETGASPATSEAAAKTLSDNTVPAAPANLQYRGSTASTVLLRWNAASDDDGIKRYDIYANGAKMFSTTATSFNVFNLESSKSYAFTVKAVDNNNNESPESNQVTGFTHAAGINYKYYTSTTYWTALPNYNSLTPARQGVTDSININNSSINTATLRYGFLWQGFIYIPVTANYTFETISDDGSKVYIDVPYSVNATALVSNDGVHGMVSRTGSITLNQGYHSIAVAYFQGNYGYGMEMYWSNNAGLARERIPKNFFASTSGSVNAAPAIPSGLAAGAVAYNKINLSWVDNSNNETAFEIFKSGAVNGTYVAVGKVSAGATTFADSALNASTTYYYKLRSINESSESGFSGVANATTNAMPATPVAPSNLSAESGGGNAVALSWDDNSANETGFLVYRSANGSNYDLIASLTPNTNAYTDMSGVALVSYFYYVAGVNGSGTGQPSNIIRFKAGNNAPAFSGLAGFFAKTGQTAIEDFVISDDAGDQVNVSIVDKPAFVEIANVSGNNYRITANATQDNVGWYTLNLVAVDNYGRSTSAFVTITVADNKTRSVFIKVGTKSVVSPWNNWTGTRAAGSVIGSLKDENNATTAISLTSVTAWSGVNVLGHITGNNSGIVPDAVLDNGLLDNGAAKSFLFSGLNPSMRYNIALVGSMNEGLVATAQCVSGSQSAIIDSRYNTTRAANLNGLTPTASGQISFTITRTGASAFSYLNAIILEEYASSVTLLNPENLYAEALDRNRIALSWSDRTSNEAAGDGYQLQRATDSLFTQNAVTFALPANSTTYTNTGLIPNTKYWYRVRAKNGSNFSEYSNKFTVVTPASIVYVNFNTTITNAAAPWNNLQTTPMSEFVVDNLKDQSGAGSNISIRLTRIFNGEFTAGVNTGNNSGIVPDNVLASNFWLDNSQISQFKLSGLNHSRRYRIGFVGSSSSTGWFKGNYTASYTINGRTVYLNSWMNSTKVVYISDVVPNAAGEVFLDFSTSATGQWAFNAGIIIHEYTDKTGGSILYMSNSELDNEVASTNNRLKVLTYPNPFSDQIRIEFTNSSAQNKITTEMYDMYGRLVLRQNHNNVFAGRNLLKIAVPESAAKTGTFIIALKVNGRVEQTVKMLRNRR